ncbi:site-specific integrase [Salinibacterium sp. ZJ454]|uniref:site-specific integrase n=1 Tax=Salinibacterium sp. ZJ454 TaxID=2708339 RepID=UPI00142184A3|nr:site-specific integrase [Salinibacterium sp. ZJ454]
MPISDPYGALQVPAHIADRVASLRGSGMAANTRRGYSTAWRSFAAWCAAHGLQSLPATPSTVVHYVIDRSDAVEPDGTWRYTAGTVQIWLSAINKVHDAARFERPGNHPDVREVMEGICREKGRPPRRVLPLTMSPLKATLASIDLASHPKGVTGHRDYALILLGFSGAFRRSELAALEIRDFTIRDDDGCHVLLRRSKTDQNGRGTTKGIPVGHETFTCSQCAITRWLRVLVAARQEPADVALILASATAAKHVCGELPNLLRLIPPFHPLFPAIRKGGNVTSTASNGGMVASALKRRLTAAGINAAEYSGHSLRAGFVTEAFRSGATTHEIMRQTGHRNPATVEIYARETDPLQHNAVARLGL